MPETIERATCPCGRPVHRYVTVRVRKSPLEPETVTTYWLHDGLDTFACEQLITDSRSTAKAADD